MKLNPPGEPSADANFAYDPADFPPPDRSASIDRASRGGVRTDAVPVATATSAKPAAAAPRPAALASVVDSGSCMASYYDEPQATASGERFDPQALTAASPSLPFNTRVRVTNINSGRSVVVRINDRGPFVSGRCLDLSMASFRTIAALSTGVVKVRYDVLT